MDILSQWACFSLSTRSFIGSVQNSAHPLPERGGLRLQQLRGVVAYLTRVNTAYSVTHLYANEIYARDECHAMILVSWIETFIFMSDVIIQMKPMK